MHDRGLLFNTLKKAGAHSLIYGMGMSFTAISSILLVPLYTKSLTPADYGIYSLISIIASLLFFLYDFGMINAVFRWYYQYSPDQSHLRRRVISTALLFLFGLALFFTILLWVFAPFLSRVVLHSDKFAPFIRLMLLGVFLQSLTWVPLSLLRIKEKVLTFTSITVLGMIVMVIANYLFLSMGRGIGGIYEAYIIAYIFVGVFLYLKTHQNYAIEFSLTELKGMLKFGVPYLPVLFFSWMIDFSDRYLLGRLSTLQEVGLYSVGYKLRQLRSTEKLPHDSHDRRGVDERTRSDGLVFFVHAVAHIAGDLDQSHADLVLKKLADGTHAPVAEVVNIVDFVFELGAFIIKTGRA